MDNTSNNDANAQSTSKIKVEKIGDNLYRASSENSKYIIEYDRDKCIGAASCAAIAGLTFYMDDENKAKIREDVVDFDADDTILAGAQSCPVFAIKIINKETGETVFPVE